MYCKRVYSKLRQLFSKLNCDTLENTGGKLFYKIQHMLNQKHERCVRNICRIHATFWQNKISICFLSTGVNIIWRYLCFRGEYFVFNLDDRKAPSIHQRIWSRKGGDHKANKTFRTFLYITFIRFPFPFQPHFLATWPSQPLDNLCQKTISNIR